MGKIIPHEIFVRRHTVTTAQFLLGKILARTRPDGTVTRHIITETEAYHSEKDLACHASKGRTARTDVLFRPGGVWYVYLCYGIHEMLNLVVGPKDFPGAVLFRGVHDAIGPGRLTKSLEIGRSLNGKNAELGSGLWLEDHGLRVSKTWIRSTPRIGVDYAGHIWAAKPWRFVISAEGSEALIDRFAKKQARG
ncbi:MAG TPA: DNA-3-methyladenine glycosylase [Opitutaceae bacterium]|nr:DNA-3-methyladenine glycosylase [Opitutaceae bacterium]